MIDESNPHGQAVREALHDLMEADGWLDPSGLVSTDILVLVAQRGFHEDGSVHRVARLLLSDTPPHILLGMMDSARLQYEQQIRDAEA